MHAPYAGASERPPHSSRRSDNPMRLAQSRGGVCLHHGSLGHMAVVLPPNNSFKRNATSGVRLIQALGLSDTYTAL
jgi:hypothetical protein